MQRKALVRVGNWAESCIAVFELSSGMLIAMDGINQGSDFFRVNMLVNTVAKIENVPRSIAKTLQDFMSFFTDCFVRGV